MHGFINETAFNAKLLDQIVPVQNESKHDIHTHNHARQICTYIRILCTWLCCTNTSNTNNNSNNKGAPTGGTTIMPLNTHQVDYAQIHRKANKHRNNANISKYKQHHQQQQYQQHQQHQQDQEYQQHKHHQQHQQH